MLFLTIIRNTKQLFKKKLNCLLLVPYFPKANIFLDPTDITVRACLEKSCLFVNKIWKIKINLEYTFHDIYKWV